MKLKTWHIGAVLIIVIVSFVIFLSIHENGRCEKKLPIEWSLIGEVTNKQKNTDAHIVDDIYSYDIYTINNTYTFNWSHTENITIGDIVELRYVNNCGVNYVSKR